MNLKLRMVLSIGVVAFLSFALTIGIVAVKAGKMAKDDAEACVTEMAYRYSAAVKAETELAMDAARTLALTFEAFKKNGQMPSREGLDGVMKQVLQGNPSFLAVWTVWEPDALDGRDRDFVNAPGHDATGRYVPYWVRSGGKISVEPLVGYDTPGPGDYYQVPKRTGQEAVVEPYLYDIDGRTMMITSLCMPIHYNGKVVGVAGVDLSLESLQQMLSSIKIFETGYISVISNGGSYVSHPKKERLGQSLLKTDSWAETLMDNVKTGKGFVVLNHSRTLGEDVGRVCRGVQIGNTSTPWAVMVTVPMDEVLEKATNLKYLCIGIGALAMFLLMATLIFIVNGITGPIQKGVQLAGVMATGDFSRTLEIHRNDEVGKLVESLNLMTSDLGGMARDITSGVEILSSSSTDLAAISEQMSQGAGETSEKSGAVAAAAEEMSASMTSIAAAMEQASTNVSMVAAASEEMTSTIQEVARNTELSRTITDTAVSRAKTASDKIDELGIAAREIDKVTETITDISEQTNLLALNATIEAARAGEAGKGFAVVATEIKELARLTSEATNDIREKISGIQQTTEVSVESIQAITKIIDDINEIVSTTATAVEEQAATTREIAGNVAQASQGLSEINENVIQSSEVSKGITEDISEVSRQSMEMTASSSTVSSNAGELLKLAERLTEMVGQFKF